MKRYFYSILFFVIILYNLPAAVYGWSSSCYVEIISPESVCVGETATLSIHSNQGGGSCRWSATPGLTPSGCTAEFTGPYEGDFWVNVTYSSGYDYKCSDVDMISVVGGDKDGDGHYPLGSCAEPADDCDDNDSTVYPGATEVCDNKDNDCNGEVDEGVGADADGDGHYPPDSCKTPNDDCDDGDPATYPGASEICDGKDNDCDGEALRSCQPQGREGRGCEDMEYSGR